MCVRPGCAYFSSSPIFGDVITKRVLVLLPPQLTSKAAIYAAAVAVACTSICFFMSEHPPVTIRPIPGPATRFWKLIRQNLYLLEAVAEFYYWHTPIACLSMGYVMTVWRVFVYRNDEAHLSSCAFGHVRKWIFIDSARHVQSLLFFSLSYFA